MVGTSNECRPGVPHRLSREYTRRRRARAVSERQGAALATSRQVQTLWRQQSGAAQQLSGSVDQSESEERAEQMYSRASTISIAIVGPSQRQSCALRSAVCA